MTNMNIKLIEGQLINNSKRENYKRIENQKSFKDVIEDIKYKEVKFSKHASKRIETRNVNFNKEEINKIQEALAKAEQKDVKDALIVMNGKILITNVETRTVITTFMNEQMEDNVITKIDGAVFL